jgi:hypothetical protein
MALRLKSPDSAADRPRCAASFSATFPTRVIKGVHQRVDMQLHSMALLEGCESVAGTWRDLRTVFEFAGITDRNQEAPS